MSELYIYDARGTVICLSEDQAMGNGITVIVGASAVLDFDHKGIFPSVRNITDDTLKRNI